MSGRAKRGWRVLLQPKVLIPVLLTAAILAFLFSVADLPKVFGRISEIGPTEIAITFALALGYLLLKGLELRYLLHALDLRVGWRRLVLAYAIGEMTLTIPAGVYVQNYVLERLGSAGFARSAAATTAMLALEGPVVLVVVLVFGVSGWPWIRPTIAGLLGFFALLALALLALRRSGRVRRGVERLFSHKYLRRLGRGLADLGRGLRALASPQILSAAVALTVAYLGLLAWAFLVVAHGVGIAQLTYVHAATIYAFSLAVMLLLGGLLSQLGVIETAGLAAAGAMGYPFDAALAMLLGFRVVWIGSVWVICGLTALALRREFASPSGDELEEAAD